MPPSVSRFTPNATSAPRVALALRRSDGSPWVLTVSPGMERFIGYYPRLEGVRCAGPVLEYNLLVAGR